MTIAAKDETINEIRRRAVQAEQERDDLRRRLEDQLATMDDDDEGPISIAEAERVRELEQRSGKTSSRTNRRRRDCYGVRGGHCGGGNVSPIGDAGGWLGALHDARYTMLLSGTGHVIYFELALEMPGLSRSIDRWKITAMKTWVPSGA